MGDSEEQNGSWKIHIAKRKKELVMYKVRIGIPIVLNQNNIVSIVNIVWSKSFGQVRTNRKAIAICGWGPLNQALLVHPEILKTKPESIDVESNNKLEQQSLQETPSISTKDSPTGSLNISNGFLARFLLIFSNMKCNPNASMTI